MAAVFAGEAAVFVEDDFVRINDEDTVDAVNDDGFVFGNEPAGIVQADDGRDVEAAAENGGVAGRAATSVTKAVMRCSLKRTVSAVRGRGRSGWCLQTSLR